MQKKHLVLHVYAALLACVPTLAIPVSWAAADLPAAPINLKKLEKKYAAVGSFEADYTQEVYQAALARAKTSKGVIMLSKPLYVRWETAEPEKTVLVSDGVKLFYYTPNAGAGDKGQVLVKPATEIASNALIGILNGTIPIEKEFLLKSSASSAQGTSLVLLPKKRMSDIQEVALEVNPSYLITEIKLIHSSGNRTKISLQNTKLGAKLPTNLFRFTPPPGTNVVDPEK